MKNDLTLFIVVEKHKNLYASAGRGVGELKVSRNKERISV